VKGQKGVRYLFAPRPAPQVGRGKRYLTPFCVLVAIAACESPAPHDDELIKPFAAAGDAERGREIFIARDGGHCVLCHAAPGIEVAGNVGPSLAGVGSRLTVGQLRLRVADMARVKPDAAMPSFHRLEGLARVAPEYAGRPVLDGQQVEDVVAWLATLR
jgi:L-cysteine S-thiosulfotransferase